MKSLTVIKKVQTFAESCPFCESDDLEVTSSPMGGYQVHCIHCDARGPDGDTDFVDQWNAALHKVQKQVNELTASVETLEAAVSTMQKAGTDVGTIVPTPLTP